MKRNYQAPIATLIDLFETDLIRTSAIWDATNGENIISANGDWFNIPNP